MTKKWADFVLFKQAVELIERGEHLTTEGLNKLVSIKASMNRGLSDKLKESFSGVTLALRPEVKIKLMPDPQWLAGFTAAEGCFFVVLTNSQKSVDFLGESVWLRFMITQHSRDEEFLINCLIKYLGCGKYYSRSNKEYGELIVEKFTDIVEIIIPFFDKYKLQGAKQKDFEDFKKVALLMQDKVHLTSQGLEEIRKIKSGMNTRS